MKKDRLRGKLMNDSNTANKFYKDNFAQQRVEREFEKYGRTMNQQAFAHPHSYEKHSIEPEYGHYDRPINEIV